jgi:serine/threonine-protein kinase
MSNSYASGDGATTDFDPSPRTAGGRRFALIGESGQHITSEIECLLRRRLRLAAAITLAGFGIYLVRGLLDFASSSRRPPDTALYGLAVHALVVGVMIAVATALWSSWRLSLRWLRFLELALFGAAAAFFLFLQFAVFHNGAVLQLALDTPASQERVLRMAAAGNSLRWFILIVIYGTFIPNTWRRCALVVGLMTLTPLSLTAFTCGSCPLLHSHLGQVLIDMSVALGMGAAIAIFGSYKISELQQEALAARKLGQYQLKERLGKGGMGEVYLGEHVLLRRACAIKLIRPDQVGDPTNLSRFEREVQAMATLTHWNTVEVYDYGHASDGTFYYVMEYLPGLSLQDLVAGYGPLSPERAVHFLRQICGALSEAHAIGLIHRDVKPSNVIACERGGVHDVAKLLDFGLVHGQGFKGGDARLTIQGTILGSPQYMAPEQALGKSALDARTDIYSVGGLAYYLLTGQPPFPRETAMEMMVAQVHQPAASVRELRPEVPADLAEVVLRCLQKAPEERYQDADSLEQALAACECADQWGRCEAKAWWREKSVTRARRALESPGPQVATSGVPEGY